MLASWGPGKFDAELFLDGKAFRPDGKTGGDADPAGVRPRRRRTCTPGPAGARSPTGTRSSRTSRCTARARSSTRASTTRRSSRSPRASGFGHVQRRRRGPHHLEAGRRCTSTSSRSRRPTPPAGSFDARAPRSAARSSSTARRSARRATCRRSSPSPAGTCTPREEIGIDDFQANRSPDGRYRTTPLRGLFAHQKGGFYHDGRFATLADVVEPLRHAS